MPAEREEQRADQYVYGDDEWQGDLFMPAGSTSLPQFDENPFALDTAIPAAFVHGHMIPIVPLPSQEHSPMTSNLLRSNDESILPSMLSAGPMPEHNPVLDFPLQMRPWQDNFFAIPNLDNDYHAPVLEDSHGFVSFPSNGLPLPATGGIETMPMTTLQGAHLAHHSDNISSAWDVIALHPPPPAAPARPPGPTRKSKPKDKRFTPLVGARGAKATQTKSPTSCWRCRKYRKAVRIHCY